MAKASDNAYPSLLLVEQAAAPATPAAGQARLYRGTDNKLYIVDDTGTATEVGAASSGGSGSRALLKEVILAADTATISFAATDIPTSGWNHLELIITGRTTQVATSSPVYVAFNGDLDGSGTNYYRQIHGINGSTAYANAQAGRELLYLAGASAAAGQGGSSRALISNYRSTSLFKTALSQVSSGAVFTAQVGQNWKNIAAITTIDLTNPANFAAGTVCRLYGLT